MGHSLRKNIYARPFKKVNKYKKIKIIKRIFSDHNLIELEISNKRKLGISTIMCNLDSIPLNKQCTKEEINQNVLMRENEDTMYSNFWDAVEEVLVGKFVSTVASIF